MNSDVFGIIFYFVLTLWLSSWWLRDIKTAAKNPFGKDDGNAGMPGATPCYSWIPFAIAIAGTLILLVAETTGEIALGIADEQSDISAFLIFALISGAIVEEFVFRGFLVIETRGNAIRWLSILGFSLIFALLHPYFWSYEAPANADELSIFSRALAGTQIHFTTKAFFTTGFIFVGSVWFYFVRFFKWNPTHSILVPVAAHLTKNLAVFFIKLAEGHVTSWF